MPRKALFVEADNFSSDSDNEMVFWRRFRPWCWYGWLYRWKRWRQCWSLYSLKFLGKRIKKYSAIEVKEDTSEGYVVNFLWRKSSSWKLFFAWSSSWITSFWKWYCRVTSSPKDLWGDQTSHKTTSLRCKFESIFSWIQGFFVYEAKFAK